MYTAATLQKETRKPVNIAARITAINPLQQKMQNNAKDDIFQMERVVLPLYTGNEKEKQETMQTENAIWHLAGIADKSKEFSQTKKNMVWQMVTKNIALPHKKEILLSHHISKQNPLQIMQSAQNPLQRRATETALSQPEKKNRNGLPKDLKKSVEMLSGYNMDDVKVHYDSDKPAHLHALAYAQGTDIHIAPGEEKHLPHEAWHVVQQKGGRVRPTLQMKDSPSVNDNAKLEKEADIMGAKSLTLKAKVTSGFLEKSNGRNKCIIQRLPNKNDLYWRRMREKLNGARLIAPHLKEYKKYILDIRNEPEVGKKVRIAVSNAEQEGKILKALDLQKIVDDVINPQMAATGQYDSDTSHNIKLTAILQSNTFIRKVMSGRLQNAIPGRRGVQPTMGTIQLPVNNADDRVLEAVDLFNRLVKRPDKLPEVSVKYPRRPDAAMSSNKKDNTEAEMDVGWAAARGTILHEFGHLLENNLGPAEFATLHNFLTARTQGTSVEQENPGTGDMTGMRANAGYFFEHHPGYQIDMPAINTGKPNHSKNVLTKLYKSTPLRYIGLFGSGLIQQAGQIISQLTGRREFRNWASRGVEDFFVNNANNENLSYSTATHQYNLANAKLNITAKLKNDEYKKAVYDGSTEYLSTTTEMFNRPDQVRELVTADPLRVALFLYFADRNEYDNVRKKFDSQTEHFKLNNLIHVIE